MRRFKELVISVGSNLSSQVIVAVTSVVFFAFFARILTESEMALFALLGVLTSWNLLFSGFGVATLSCKEIPTLRAQGKIETSKKYLTSTLFYRSLFGLLITILIICFSRLITLRIFGTSEYLFQFCFVAVIAFLQNIARTLHLMQVALQRFVTRAIASLLMGILTKVLALLGYFCLGFNGFLIGFGVGVIFTIIFLLWLTRKEFTFRIYSLIKLIKNSRSYLGVEILRQLQNSLDQTIVAFVLGDIALADYYVAKRIFEFLRQIIQSVAKPIAVKFSEVKAQGIAAFNDYFNKSFSFISMIFIPAGFAVAVLSKPLLEILGGQKYVNSYMILSFFGITVMVFSLYEIIQQAIYRLFRGSALLLLLLLSVGSSSILYFLILPFWGLKGIPLVMAVSFMIAVIVSVYFLISKASVKFNYSVIFRGAACGILIFLSVMLLYNLPDTIYRRISMFLTAAIVYSFSVVIFAPPQMKNTVKTILRKARLTKGSI